MRREESRKRVTLAAGSRTTLSRQLGTFFLFPEAVFALQTPRERCPNPRP
jgi:hypothetical protein